ncbi:MAG: permease-like cell division protein FtsX [Nitrospirota bacterium]
MSLYNITHFIEEALNNIRRNAFVTVITVGTIALSFLILGVFLIIFSNLKDITSSWQEQIQIVAYLKEGLSSADITSLEEKIRAEREVSSAHFISKDKALSEFKKDLANQTGLLDGLGENPLPAYFEVKIKKAYQDSGAVSSLAERFKKIKGIEDVQYGQEWVENLSSFLDLMVIAGLVVGGLVSLAVILIVSNTVKLTVYARAEDIEIMKLIGATDWFVKIPFLIEGVVIGLVGAFLSIAILFGIYQLLMQRLSLNAGILLGKFSIAFLSWPDIAILLFAGMLLGLFGSFVSVGRFLKV